MSSTTNPTGTTSTDNSNDNSSNNNDDIDMAEIIKKLPRDCIKCDSPECNVYNPRNRCSKCHCNYYCSVTCQKNDWKNHKPYCISIDFIKGLNEQSVVERNEFIDKNKLLLKNNTNNDNNDNNQYLQNDNDECAICLEKPMKNPTFLNECHHGFCSSCILQWQQSRKLNADLVVGFHDTDDETAAQQQQRNILNCPCCRSETVNDTEENLLKNAILLCARATCDTIQSNQLLREELLRESISYLDQVISSNLPDINSYFMKADILFKLNEPKAALETIELLLHVSNERKKHPVMILMEERENAVLNNNHTRSDQLTVETVIALKQYGMPSKRLCNDGYYRTYNLQIRCYEKLNQWDHARQTHQKVELCMENSKNSKNNTITSLLPQEQQFHLYCGLGKCLYELKRYQHSIDTLSIAIYINRQHPQIHLYKALSQQKLNHIDDAVNTMTCAIIHETPWDIINQKENYIVYQQFKLQKEQQEKMNKEKY